MFKGLFCLLFVCLQLPLFAQNTIGLPKVINYLKHTYSGGTQNWDVKQDEAGILYFANNEGLLTFDGIYWNNYPLPNKTIVRSLAISSDRRIYVGGQDEIGYFSPDKNGTLVFTSLKSLLPKADQMFTDVWDIIEFENSIFFRLDEKIFQLTGNKMAVYKSSQWRYMGLSNGMLIAQDINKGLLRFKGGFWQPFTNSTLPAQALVTAFIPLNNDSSLLVTLKHGLYIYTQQGLTPLQSPAIQNISTSLIYTAATTGPNHIALATTMDGVFIINKQGGLVQHLSRTEGLQNNNVLSLFVDRDHNLWVGLDNGIDLIAYNNAIKHITPNRQNNATAYTSIIYNGQLYIGTSSGLYAAPLTDNKNLSFVKSSFTPVDNASGQVWNLSEVNGQLLMGHHEGAFIIKNGTAHPVNNTSGYWTFMPYNNVLPSSLMVAGTYAGIHFYRYANGSFIKESTVPFESARFVTIDNNNIWVSHPYKGIFRVEGSGNHGVKKYGKNEGLPSINNNYVFKVKSRIVAATEKGIYEYNEQLDRYEPSAYFKDLLPQKGIRYLKEDAQGNIWFVYEKALGILDFSGLRPQTVLVPELNNQLVSGFEHVYFIDKNNVLVGGENGCYHIDYEQYRQAGSKLQVHIRSIKAIGNKDSLLFGGYVDPQRYPDGMPAPKLQSNFNSFQITFAATQYGQQDNLQYSYYLKGFDKTWTEWTRKTEKEYTYLPAGTYTFLLRARNNLGKESALSSYTFTILPPWYLTPWAYSIYILLAIGAAYTVTRWQKRKFARQRQAHHEEQKRLQYLHQLELERNEREIIKLKNDKLEADIEFKNSELASSAMHLVQKGELIAKLKDELNRLMKKIDNPAATDDLKKLLRTLGNDDKMDKDWEHFSQHFDKVHSDLLLALKARHPNLSPNELKLCAYLRMNLTSKEVAQLLNISVRGVEISRYRLRKKLQIPTETNLFDYLISIQSDGTVVPVKPLQPTEAAQNMN